MKLTVRYFAMLREQVGASQEEVQTAATTPAELFEELVHRHGLTIELKALKVAVNEEFVPMEYALSDGDAVVFIPPVAGG